MAKSADISRIPPEILTKIFIHCLPKVFTPQLNDQPVLLSSVCRLWRALALATPALWASLDITFRVGFPRPPFSDIQTRLQRSGTHSLSFRLNAVDSPSRVNSPYLSTILTALTAVRERWREVDIIVGEMTQEILDLTMLGDAPLLQSIRWDVSFTQGHSIPLHMLDHCLHLESFSLCSAGSSLLLPQGITQLTSLSLDAALSVSECITLLRLSPHLLSAVFDGLYGTDSSPAPHVVHFSLCTLTVAGAYCDILLTALTLPALLDLTLMIWNAEWDTKVIAFLGRSNPTLRLLSLRIHRIQIAEPGFLRILALVPQLSTLILNPGSVSPPLPATFIRALNPLSSPGAPLCPRLQRLELLRIEECPDELCAAMIHARRGAQADANGVASLERASLKVEGDAHRRAWELEHINHLGTDGEGAFVWRKR